ncbi:MAG TPA: DNA-binding transcriptional regulator [Kiritimatiellia bacterium]|nr:DNA-binding transcriptional regulator [Kiritimatiellia bacterium]HRU70165.1 DNA-binding transcriptional regulator [Kiritimatiellia bacterium]
MSKFLQKIPRVLAILSTVEKACRDKLQGILKYARLNGPWDVQTLEDHPFIAKLGAFKNWQPDGVIYGVDDVKDRHLIGSIKAPLVSLDTDASFRGRASTVCHDSQLIAETVADHFMRLSLRQFGFVGSVPSSSWSQMRKAAFSDRLRRAGFGCHVYEPVDEEDWGLEQKHMSQWLQSLPKPCGVMVAVDLRAKQVLDTCLAASIRVPEEIAVIGVDNDETICENTMPSLSSVLPDFEGGGYLAAALLDRLMRGTQEKPAHLTYGIKRIVHRQSSQYVQRASRLIASAIEFIRLNACSGITVMDVVQHLNVSRRFAERHFREAYGHSILNEIQHTRLERVCTLLRETNLPISEIGVRCGYGAEIYLKVLFKKTYGMTMREYRNARSSFAPPSLTNASLFH